MDRTAWIVIVLCVAGLLGWGWWQSKEAEEYAKKVQAWEEYQRQNPAENPETTETGSGETSPDPADPNSPEGTSNPTTTTGSESSDLEIKEIELGNDSIQMRLTNRGGGIDSVSLLHHQRSLRADDGYVIINDQGAHAIGVLSEGPGRFDSKAWEITEQTDTAVAFTQVTPEKLRVTKRFVLPAPDAEPHQIRLQMSVKNESEATVQTGSRYLYLGSAAPLHKGEWPRQTGFYFRDEENGDVVYKSVEYFKGRKFLGIGSDPRANADFEIAQVGWAGVNDQFFTTLLRPAETYPARIWASSFPVKIAGLEEEPEKKQLRAVEAALSLPAVSMAPGDQRTFEFELYLGPKEFNRLNALGHQQALVMKYDDTPIFGWMFGWAIRPLASVLIRVLGTIQGWVGSYGVAIILVTILIRLIIWPVYAKSTRTMKRMSKLTPMMNEIKEKYKDDQERQSKELMKLYGDYGVNPLGGCLPMFIQLPVFLAFYGMLWRAAELRHESFLWVEDLSMPDTLFMIPLIGIPFNLLPLLMAGTTFIQMSMTPKTGDKTQQMVFKLMPLFFLVICYNFASALALYWTTQNVFSIFQTWLMNRLPEPELKKKKRKPGGSFMQRLQDQAQQRQKTAKSAGGGGGQPSAPGGADRTKLASEKGDRHTKGKGRGKGKGKKRR